MTKRSTLAYIAVAILSIILVASIKDDAPSGAQTSVAVRP